MITKIHTDTVRSAPVYTVSVVSLGLASVAAHSSRGGAIHLEHADNGPGRLVGERAA